MRKRTLLVAPRTVLPETSILTGAWNAVPQASACKTSKALQKFGPVLFQFHFP